MKHINLIALGGIVIILGILFGIATIKVTGKYRFERSAHEMLEKVTTESKQLSLKEAAELINNDNVIFIDIRTPKEFVGFHIQNVLIYGNYFANTGANNTWNTGIGIWGYGLISNYTIRNNVFHNIDGDGIRIDSTDNEKQPCNIDYIYVYNNLFDTMASDGDAINLAELFQAVLAEAERKHAEEEV